MSEYAIVIFHSILYYNKYINTLMKNNNTLYI